MAQVRQRLLQVEHLLKSSNKDKTDRGAILLNQYSDPGFTENSKFLECVLRKDSHWWEYVGALLEHRSSPIIALNILCVLGNITKAILTPDFEVYSSRIVKAFLDTQYEKIICNILDEGTIDSENMDLFAEATYTLGNLVCCDNKFVEWVSTKTLETIFKNFNSSLNSENSFILLLNLMEYPEFSVDFVQCGIFSQLLRMLIKNANSSSEKGYPLHEQRIKVIVLVTSCIRQSSAAREMVVKSKEIKALVALCKSPYPIIQGHAVSSINSMLSTTAKVSSFPTRTEILCSDLLPSLFRACSDRNDTVRKIARDKILALRQASPDEEFVKAVIEQGCVVNLLKLSKSSEKATVAFSEELLSWIRLNVTGDEQLDKLKFTVSVVKNSLLRGRILVSLILLCPGSHVIENCLISLKADALLASLILSKQLSHPEKILFECIQESMEVKTKFPIQSQIVSEGFYRKVYLRVAASTTKVAKLECGFNIQDYGNFASKLVTINSKVFIDLVDYSLACVELALLLIPMEVSESFNVLALKPMPMLLELLELASEFKILHVKNVTGNCLVQYLDSTTVNLLLHKAIALHHPFLISEALKYFLSHCSCIKSLHKSELDGISHSMNILLKQLIEGGQ